MTTSGDSASTHVIAVLDGEEAWVDDHGRLPRRTLDHPELRELVPSRPDLMPLAPAREIDGAQVHVLRVRQQAPPPSGWRRAPLPSRH